MLGGKRKGPWYYRLFRMTAQGHKLTGRLWQADMLDLALPILSTRKLVNRASRRWALDPWSWKGAAHRNLYTM